MHMSSENIPVLMYHHVGPTGGSLTVSAEHFEQQIRGLAEKGYRSLGAAELEGFFRGQAVAPKSVVLTFDDGYLDNWVYAHPVLEKYGMTGIMFIITGLIGEGTMRPYQGQGQALPPWYPHQESKHLMFGNEPDRVMLRWEEVYAMRRTGTFEFHSHTHTHKRWDKLCVSSQQKSDALRKDLHDSQRCLQEKLGGASAHLCWPQGYFDADYVTTARELGFEYLYTTDARGQNTIGSDPGHIYRFAVRNRSYPWLQQRLWLATHPTLGPWYNRWKAKSDAKKQQRRIKQ